MSSFDLQDVMKYGETEELAIMAFAKIGGNRRIYKVANDYGDKVAHTNYCTVNTPQEELSVLFSLYVHNVVLVYDDGELVQKPVKFNDTSNGREVLGIDFLSTVKVKFLHERNEVILGATHCYRHYSAPSLQIATAFLNDQIITAELLY